MPGKLKILLFAICFFSAEIMNAQGWNRITALPQRGFFSLEIVNNVMYAGAYDTLYVSKDNGTTWNVKPLPTSGYSINAIAVYNGRIYAGTGDGVYESDDGGNIWSSGNIRLAITSFTVWNGFLYAATNGGGIFRCIQIGNSWSPFNQAYPVATAGSVAKIVTFGRTLFAAGGMSGAGYRYDSSAGQWREIFYLNTSVPGMKVYDLMQGGGSIFALSDTAKLLRSDDNAATWYTDSTDMRRGINGTVLKASLQYYIAWNLDAGGTWIQSRDIAAAPGTSWATGEELLPTGHTYAMREYNRNLYLAKDNGIFYKANGSGPVGVTTSVSNGPQALIYPNPSQDGMVIIKAEGIKRLEVWDISGRLVREVAAPPALYQLQLPGAGSYMLRLTSGEGVTSRMVIVR